MARKRTDRTAARGKQFVVSFRVNEEEWKALKRETEHSGVSVSRLLRANLHLLLQADRKELL